MTTNIPYSAPTARAAGYWRVWLLVVILAGCGMRLFEPGRMLYWHDEAYTLLRVFGHTQADLDRVLFTGRVLRAADLVRFQRPDAGKSWSDTLSALVRHPEQSPLYYLLARATAAFAIPPESGPRLFSALIGLLLAPAVFWLMRELWGPGKAPWIAAALVSASPLHLLYAQEARPYALWMVLLTAASAALLPALRRGRVRDWGIYGALLCLGFYAHLLSLLLIPLHGLYAAVTHRGPPPVRWLAATLTALLLFSPWLLVLALQADMVGHYLAWMERPLSTARLLHAWGGHLIRLFFDPGVMEQALLLGLLPLAAALAYFCRSAPGPGRWLVCLIGGTWVAVVLGPDLLSGGTRSVHARYALPSLLAMQLALAWVLAALWERQGIARHAAVTLLALLLLLGGWSQWRILQADSWWSKNFSARNTAVARQINATDHPLLLLSSQGVSQGELLSVLLHLRPDVAVWGEPLQGEAAPPDGYASVFVLTPSPQLRERLAADYRLEPLFGSWQWFQATPPAEGGH